MTAHCVLHAMASPPRELQSEAPQPRRGVCEQQRVLHIPYHNKADGFMAALVLTLNQVWHSTNSAALKRTALSHGETRP